MTEEEIEARGERAPVSLVPSLDVTMDDLKRYERSIKEHVVRYAGCADVYVSVRGPLHPIHVNPVLPGPAKTYRGVPAQARVVRGGGGGSGETATTAVPHTWEDDRVVANRLARATYGPHVDPPAASSGHVEWKHEDEEEEEDGVKEHEKETPPPANLSFYPVFVRVSCVDGDGYVSEPSEKYRISGFGVDAWRGL